MQPGIHHLLQSLALQQLLYGLAWWLMGRLRPEMRRTALHWVVFSGGSALALLLVVARPWVPPWLGISGATWLMLASFVALRRASETFFHLKPADAEHLGMLGLMAVVLLWSGPGPDGNALRVPVLVLLTAAVALRGVRQVHGPMKQEFGAWLSWLTHVPVCLGAAALVGRTAWALGQPADRLMLDQILLGSGLIGYLLLAVAGSIHFAYGGMQATRLSRRLLHLSRHDGLTGLLNHQAGAEQLAVEWQRMRRQHQPFAVLALDLDHFKQVNDQHGHAAGDQVLTGVAEVLQQAIRPTDSAARMGGEEFMLLMPGASPEGARALAERIRQAVRSRSADWPWLAEPVSISVGLSLATDWDRDAAEVMARADRALYLAKSAGRDCVRELP